jgi:hypothetical protein
MLHSQAHAQTLATCAMKSSFAGPRICSPRFKPLKRFALLSKDTT